MPPFPSVAGSSITGPTAEDYFAPAAETPADAAPATADPKLLPPEPVFGPVGFSGVLRFHGLVYEEYVPELTGLQKVDVYRRMASDGLVSAILQACKLPLIAASWNVEPAGKDANSKRAAELVEENLFNGLSDCWEEEVRKLLTYLQFGFHVSAKNWSLIDGTAVLSELRPLHPRTILQGSKRWQYDPQGRLYGVWQWGTDGFTWREEFIPAQALVHLVHNGDFSNPEGAGLLRPIYKHWLIKDTLYHLQAIGLERGATGTPVIQYPPGTASDLQEKLDTVARNLIAMESAGITLPQGVTLSNWSVEVKTADIMAAIHHHDAEAAKSVLAQFLNLGQEGAGGAYALSQDQTDLFLLCLEALAGYVANQFNRWVIPEIVSYNLPTDQFPTISATIKRQAATVISKFLRDLTQGIAAPYITADEGVEDHLRELAGMPPRTAPRPAPLVEETGPATKPGQAQDTGDSTEGAADQEGEGSEADSGGGSNSGGDGGAAGMQRQRERITVLQASAGRVSLPVVQYADPRAFREEAAYPEMARVIADFHHDTFLLLQALRRSVWSIAALPEPDSRPPQRHRRKSSWQPWSAPHRYDFSPLSRDQEKALDNAIEVFLGEYAGDQRTEAGFTGTESEDALLQSYLRLGHAVGQQQAVKLVGAESAALAPTRSSPPIQRLLGDSFRRLSQDGQLRLADRLGDIRTILVQGAKDGDSPFDVADTLAARFSQYEGWEFERLARTEMAFAANSGSVDEYRAQGVGQVQWMASALACPICTASDGSIVGVEEAVTGDNMPPAHPNCLCSLGPLTEGV